MNCPTQTQPTVPDTASAPATLKPARVSAAVLFVWAAWGLMLASGVDFVRSFGSNVPFWDDWTMVRVLTGREPITLAWLWAPNNEHRIPVPKLAYVALVRFSGFDWRAGMYFNVLCLGLLSAGLIAAVRKSRGYTAYSDAIFPLVLQHLGQKENLLWCFQIGFVLGVLLVGFVLILLVLGGDKAGSKAVGGVAVCLLLLPLFGANSLAFVPPLALWLLYVGVLRRRAGGAWLLVCAGVASCVCGLYFVGLRTISTPLVPNLTDRLKTTIQLLSTALGSSVRPSWPLAAAVVIALTLATAAGLLRFWWERPRERLGTLGLLLFLGGFAVLALGVGWGRAGLDGTAGLRNRYVTLSSPLICAVYGAWGQCLTARRCRLAQVFLFVVMAGLLVPNTLDGIQRASGGRNSLAAVERDARLPGMTPSELAHTYTRPPIFLLWTDSMEDELAECLEYLRQDRIGPFRGVE